MVLKNLLQYHKAWVTAGFPLNEGSVSMVLKNQLKRFQTQGSDKEKKSAKQALEKNEVSSLLYGPSHIFHS